MYMICTLCDTSLLMIWKNTPLRTATKVHFFKCFFRPLCQEQKIFAWSSSYIIYVLIIKGIRENKQAVWAYVCLYLCLQTRWAWLQSFRGGRAVQMRWGSGGGKAGEFPPPGSFCSSRVAKLKIRDEAGNKNKTEWLTSDNIKANLRSLRLRVFSLSLKNCAPRLVGNTGAHRLWFQM